jgi:hypothetical protein
MRYYFKIILIVFIPLIFGLLWTRYADSVKISSGVEILTSVNLSTWNFGTISARLNIKSWEKIYSFINVIVPIWIPILLLLFIPMIIKYLKHYGVVILAFISLLLTIFTLFNLYFVHEYYYCAIMPLICIILGYFVYYTLQQAPFTLQQKYYLLVFFILFYGWNQWKSNPLSLALFSPSVNKGFFSMIDYIKNHTDKDDLIMVFDDDWDARIPYYSNRKAMMFPYWREKKSLDELIVNNYELAIMGMNDEFNAERLSKLHDFSFERKIEEAGNIIYRNTSRSLFMKIPISIANISFPYTNDIINFEKTSDTLILTCGQPDPFIIIPMDIFHIIPKTMSYVELEYFSTHNGNLQLFFDYGTGFYETNTYNYPIHATLDKFTKILLPIVGWENGKELYKIRLDPPGESIFHISKINVLLKE